jgi:ADP-heptose:LPS heptosyltransferase
MGVRSDLFEAAVWTMRRLWPVRRRQAVRSIFVLRNNDLGDVVVMTPLFEALRRAYPEARIVAGVLSGSRAILEANPYLDEVVACNAPWCNHRVGRNNLGQALRYIFFSREARGLAAERFDVGIDLFGNGFGSMLLLRMGIPIRLGRRGWAGGHSGATACLDYDASASVAKSSLDFLRLLQPEADFDIALKPQLFLRQAERDEAERFWREYELREGKRRPRVIYAPGAGFRQKQWPIERFAELARRLEGEVNACVLGSCGDAAMGEAIAKGVLHVRNRCGTATIRQSMALIATADLVLCHGSFVMHVAPAFDRPAILLLTRLFDPQQHRALWEVAGLHHQMYPCAKEMHVHVDAVEEKARQLLGLAVLQPQ